MTAFIIVVCSRCGGYLIAKSGQKTKTCPYCGFKLAVEKAKKNSGCRNRSGSILGFA